MQAGDGSLCLGVQGCHKKWYRGFWDLQEEELMGFADTWYGRNQGTGCQPVGLGGKW